MVMLFTEDQVARNRRHDDAWADIYSRFPAASHEEKRALFLENYPDISPNFAYPERVPSRRYPDSPMHRRHVKIPEDVDRQIVYALRSDEVTLKGIFKELLPLEPSLAEENIPQLMACQALTALLAEKLYGVHEEQLAELVSVLVEFVDEAILLIKENGKVFIERDTSI